MDKVLFAKYIYEQVNQQRDILALRNNFLLTIYTAITSATIGGVFRFINNIHKYSKCSINIMVILFILSLTSSIFSAYFYFTFMLNNKQEYIKIDVLSELIIKDLEDEFARHKVINRNLTDQQIIIITNNLFDIAQINDKRNHEMEVCQIKMLYCFAISASLSIIAYCIML